MNYERYYFSGWELIRVVFEYLLIDAVVALLFFDSFTAFLIALTGVIPYSIYRKKDFLRRQKKDLKEQFLSLITVVAGKVNGGMSAENAFHDSVADMERLHGRDSLIVSELNLIVIRTKHSETLENCLSDLGRRSGISDIYEFACIFTIARLNSGQMTAVIDDTVRMMQEKNDTEAEIEVLISGKKLEQKIMSIIPLVIIAYLRIEAASFLNVLYHNLFGILVMSICLAAYIGAYFWGERIVDIHV